MLQVNKEKLCTILFWMYSHINVPCDPVYCHTLTSGEAGILQQLQIKQSPEQKENNGIKKSRTYLLKYQVVIIYESENLDTIFKC